MAPDTRDGQSDKVEAVADIAARREAAALRQANARAALGDMTDASSADVIAPNSARPTSAHRAELAAAPPCSGAVAVMRFTNLCERAQAADNAGDTKQAISLYRDLLRLNESLKGGRGPLLETLFAVARKVEKRVAELDGSTCSSAPTSGRSSAPSHDIVCIRPATAGSYAGGAADMANYYAEVAASSTTSAPRPPTATSQGSGTRSDGAPSSSSAPTDGASEGCWAVARPPEERPNPPSRKTEVPSRSASGPSSDQRASARPGADARVPSARSGTSSDMSLARRNSTPQFPGHATPAAADDSSEDEDCPRPPPPLGGRHGPKPPANSVRVRPSDVRVRTLHVRSAPQSARSTFS